MKALWLIPLIILAVLAGPVSAGRTLPAEGVSAYSFVADEGYVIYQITIDDVPIGTDQTHTLSYKGNTYLVQIHTWDDFGWKNAQVTLTYPNGTINTVNASCPSVFGGYKTTIQPMFLQSYGGSVLGVNLNIGLSQLSAEFQAQPVTMTIPQALPFTAVSGELGASTNVWVEEETDENYNKNIQNYNPNFGLTNLANQIFQWSWSWVLGFFSMIPVIGPAMVGLLDAMGGIVNTGVFWVIFVVSNFPAILCGVETLIIMMAVINAPGKNSFKKLTANIYNYNKEFIIAIIGLVELVWNWTRSAVEMVAAIVQGLKPI